MALQPLTLWKINQSLILLLIVNLDYYLSKQ